MAIATVMVSSTAKDLPRHRDQVRIACERAGFWPRNMMENLTAEDCDPIGTSLRMVEEADVYIGVLAQRYGTIVPGYDRSITEMEYDHAVKLNKPRLIFFAHDEHVFTKSEFETGSAAEKLEAFKNRVGITRVSAFFRSPEDLRSCVVEALQQLRRRLDAGGKIPKSIRSPADRPLTVGYFPYPPFSIASSEGSHVDSSSPSGPWCEVVTQVLSRLGLSFQFKPVSASDFSDQHRARPDIIMGLFRTDARSISYDFSQPLHCIGLNAVCRAELPSITKEHLLEGNLRVIVQKGEVGWEYAHQELRRVLAQGNITELDTHSTKDAIKSLISNNSDLAITDEVSCLGFLEEIGTKHAFRLAFDRPLRIFDACLAVSKDLSWPLDKIDFVLRQVRNEPEYLKREVLALRGYERIVERCLLD